MRLKLGKSNRLIENNPCPKCGIVLNGATCIDGDAYPSPGDYSVCCICGTFLRYTDTMDFQIPTELELFALDAHSRAQLLEMQKRVHEFNRMMRDEHDKSQGK